MDLYGEQIVDLAKHPLNKGAMKKPDLSASGVNTTCGDHVRLYLRVKSGKVVEATWEGDGCAISTAAASVPTEEAKGKTMKQLGMLCVSDLYEWLDIHDLGPARVKCVTLCLETLKSALLGELGSSHPQR